VHMKIRDLTSVWVSADEINSSGWHELHGRDTMDSLIEFHDTLAERWWAITNYPLTVEDIYNSQFDNEVLGALADYKMYSAAWWQMMCWPDLAKRSRWCPGLCGEYLPLGS
jgi:hypothetical protein